MILKNDCRHFPGDRPCIFHKTESIKCDNCSHYELVGIKIIIIKLDAVGDVLRTTSMLKGFKEKYPHSHITWLTRKNALMLFDNNPYVDEIYALESAETNYFLNSQHYDVAVNFDPSPVSSAILSVLEAKEKFGFILNPLGHVMPIGQTAKEWLEMGAFDDLKKNNKRTYQSIMADIADLNSSDIEIILNLSENEFAFAADFLRRNSIDNEKKIVGLNTGSGPRWELKKWTDEGYSELIKKLLAETDCYIFLYGGPYEKERNAFLSSLHPDRIIDTGGDNTLRQFFALLNLCDVLVTGDTLALHAAAALKKNVIALFGPTSSAEIEDYGRITKIIPELDCLVCYKMTCDFNPNCMQSITVQMVFDAVTQNLY